MGERCHWSLFETYFGNTLSDFQVQFNQPPLGARYSLWAPSRLVLGTVRRQAWSPPSTGQCHSSVTSVLRDLVLSDQWEGRQTTVETHSWGEWLLMWGSGNNGGWVGIRRPCRKWHGRVRRHMGRVQEGGCTALHTGPPHESCLVPGPLPLQNAGTYFPFCLE